MVSTHLKNSTDCERPRETERVEVDGWTVFDGREADTKPNTRRDRVVKFMYVLYISGVSKFLFCSLVEVETQKPRVPSFVSFSVGE